jgi:Rrf2 family protein
MLTLTRKTEYAMIAVCHLARQGANKVVSARDMAEAHGMPLPLLMNVLKKLNRAGHITSVRGARGGYVLNASPNDLTLEDLIEAVEGPVHLVRCTNPEEKARKCTLTGECPIRGSVRKVHQRLRKFLSGVTMADLAFDSADAAGTSVQQAVAQ